MPEQGITGVLNCRYRAVSELAEALRDSDFAKKQCAQVNKENKDLR